jgi:two-component system sensor histidine kinase VicK
VIARDISERKRAEQQRLELELEQEKVAMLARFIGDTSHDLRTPLSVMNTSLYLLRKTSEPDKQERYLSQLETQVRHVHRLVEDMFTLLRLDMGASEFQFGPSNLNTMVRDVCTRQHPLAAGKNHEVELNLDANLPFVLADTSELSPAVNHLVVNALNYTPNGGRIAISTYARDGQVVLEVQDNGIGIGADDLPQIFERFYRADKARQMNTGTSGLGLTIARRIVDVHGGTIEVESKEGEGTLFRMVLPPYERTNGKH